MTTAVAERRTIVDASEIPSTGGWDRVGLIGASRADARMLKAAGASQGRAGWSIPRTREVDLDRLEAHLPRIARRWIEPRMVDLIPSSSWHASLANLLMPSSWKVVRETAALRAEACEDCGAQWSLECHERWSYDDVLLIQRLDGFEALCSACHRTRHLGFASVQGRYQEACERLAAVERLRPSEVAPFCDEAFRRFEARSTVGWTLDLAVLSGSSLKLKRDVTMDDAGALSGKVGGRPVGLKVSGVRIEAVGKALAMA